MTEQTVFHSELMRRFIDVVRNDRLAHAYLFIGPAEVGKTQAALALAKLVIDVRLSGQNMETAISALEKNEDPLYRRIDAGNHPDVYMVDRGEDQTIKVSKIRELINKTQLKPFESEKKVFIVRDIDRLTTEGSNALLKTLEEPSASSLLILTTSVPENVLPTVRSRSQVINFFPMPNTALASQLRARYSVAEEDSRMLASFAEGCPGRARQFVDNQFLERKNEIIDQVVYRRDNEDFTKAVLKDKDMTKEALDVLLFWFRDLMLLKSRSRSAHIINRDRQAELADLAEQYTFEQLNNIVEAVVDALKMLGENLNIKIPFVLLKEKIWVRS